MRTAIVNAQVVCIDKIIRNGVCVFENGKIIYVGTAMQPSDKTIDAHNAYLIPGFVDIHCHGGMGMSFMGGDENDFAKIAKFHLSHGTTTLVATTCTSDDEETYGMLETYKKHKQLNPNSTIQGVFMEGPWLSPLQCGAQASDCMKLPNEKDLLLIKQKYPFVLRVGAAPELEGGDTFGKVCVALGIIASIAHTNADFVDVERAVENGYTLVTHLYSGMKGTERKNAYRVAGAIDAGLYFDELTAEVIADGKHLPIELLKLIYKCKGADKICLITDASRAAGLPDGSTTTGISRADKGTIIIEDGVAKMPDRTSFAGSASTADRLYRTMAKAIGNDMVALSKMASHTPAKVMGFHDRGNIAIGKRADLLIMDQEWNIRKIFMEGKEI